MRGAEEYYAKCRGADGGVVLSESGLYEGLGKISSRYADGSTKDMKTKAGIEYFLNHNTTQTVSNEYNRSIFVVLYLSIT